VTCKCGEISIDGGQEYLRCKANDWKNFLRIDDEGNEIIVTIKEPEVKSENVIDEEIPLPSRDDLLSMLDEMISSYERLPMHALLAPISNSDFCSSLILLSSILRRFTKD